MAIRPALRFGNRFLVPNGGLQIYDPQPPQWEAPRFDQPDYPQPKSFDSPQPMTRPSGKVPQGALVTLRRGDLAAFCFRHRGWQEVRARQRGRGWLCADPARQMQPLPGSKCHSELRWPAHVRWRKVVASRLMAQRTPPRLWRICCPREGPLSTSDSARPASRRHGRRVSGDGPAHIAHLMKVVPSAGSPVGL
jgi:hypothetical protein